MNGNTNGNFNGTRNGMLALTAETAAIMEITVLTIEWHCQYRTELFTANGAANSGFS